LSLNLDVIKASCFSKLGNPRFLNRRGKQSSVNAAVGVGGRVRFHIVKLLEREIGISNWLFNMEVIGNRRAYRDIFIASHGSIYR
jgi:hypothetical protein